MLDIDTYPTNAQIPFRFLPCLTAGLAYYLSLKYALPVLFTAGTNLTFIKAALLLLVNVLVNLTL